MAQPQNRDNGQRPVEKVLIVGAGIAGTTLAIGLQRAGISTDIVELHDQVLGVGIVLTGNTMRAVQHLDLLDSCVEQGYAAETWRVFTSAGDFVLDVPVPKAAGPNYPASIGLERPALAKILRTAAQSAGARLRTGLTVETLIDRGATVDVTFTDKTSGTYDLVVGADGAFSTVRRLIFGDKILPAYAGQSCWRWQTKRHPAVDRPMFFHGHLKMGFIPLSETTMYLLLNQNVTSKIKPDPSSLVSGLQHLLKEFSAKTVVEACSAMKPDSVINYRPFETMMVPSPWYVGRTLIVGDAAHSVTPHLGNGGGIAIEDAIVLSDLLAERQPIEPTLAKFMQRRFQRCKLVHDNSYRICQLEIVGGEVNEKEIYRITGETFEALLAPI